MEPVENDMRPSLLFPTNTVKHEGARSTCAVKQEHDSSQEFCHLASSTIHRPTKRRLNDGQQEVTTPNTKRTKQEWDNPGLYKEKAENVLLPSETSLKNIVSEIAHSVENNPRENIISFQGNTNFENANRTRPAQDDAIVVLDHAETILSQSLQIEQNAKEAHAGHGNIAPLPYPADSRKISVPSISDQVQFEPRRPILRTLKSLDSRASNGFAYDHNFFPKLVDVHSMSSPSAASTSTEIESLRDSQQKRESSKPLETLGQKENIENPLNIQKDINICGDDTRASSRTNPTLINSAPISSTTQKKYDLLFTFTQKDGQNDIFLVVNDEVFSVRRCDHEGESYLVHTDNNGQTSILAKLPADAETASQNNGTATHQSVSSEQRGDTNDLSSALQQSRRNSYQMAASHAQYITAAPVTVTAPEPNRELDAANCNHRQILHRIPRVIPGQENRILLNASDVYSERQAVQGSRNGPLNSGPGQLSQELNNMRTQTSGYRQRELASDLPRWAHNGPQTGASSQPRHHVAMAANNSLQTSTSVSSFRKHASLNSLRNQQLVLNESTASRDERHDVINVQSEQQYTNTVTQRRYSGDTAVRNLTTQGYPNRETSDPGSYKRYDYTAVLSEDEKRIINRNKLMNYITHQLASSEEPFSSTNSVSVNRISEAANAKQISSSVIANESVTRRIHARTRGEVAPHAQSDYTNGYLTAEQTDGHYTGRRNEPSSGNNLEIRDAWTAENIDGHYTGRRSGPSLGNNLEIQDVGQRYPVNQMARQNISLVNLQPRSDSQDRIGIPVQGGMRANDETDANNKILQIMKSWKRQQQQQITSQNDFSQLKQLLVATTAGVTDATTQTTAAVGTSSREPVVECCRAVQASSDTRSKPVISQVSYGVINRSIGGENLAPKRTVTALVVDQGRSIYIDATDSVIDEERRPRTTGQRRPNEGTPIKATGNNSATIHYYSSGVSNASSRSSASFQSSLIQMPNQGKSLSVSEGQRYTSMRLPRSTPKCDKRCVANNTLKETVHTRKSQREGHGVFTHISGQHSNTAVSQVNSAETDEVVEVIITPAAKPISQPETTVHPECSDKIGLISSLQRLTDEESSQRKPEVSKPCDDNDDDVEIIYATPKYVSKPNVTPGFEVINEAMPWCGPQMCTKIREGVQTVHSPPKQNSQPNTTVSIKEKNKVRQSCTDDMVSKRLIKTKDDGVVENITPTSEQNYQPNTTHDPESKDNETIISCDKTSLNSSVTETDGDDVVEIINPPTKKESDAVTTECSENVEKEKAHFEQFICNETDLKNVQQRDELLKKIDNTRERMEQEQIDWKKKYLHRLDVQLKKKLAKLSGVTEHTMVNKDNE